MQISSFQIRAMPRFELYQRALRSPDRTTQTLRARVAILWHALPALSQSEERSLARFVHRGGTEKHQVSTRAIALPCVLRVTIALRAREIIRLARLGRMRLKAPRFALLARQGHSQT